LEKDLILAYYKLEKKRYPDEPESQRLMDAASKTVNFTSPGEKQAI